LGSGFVGFLRLADSHIDEGSSQAAEIGFFAVMNCDVDVF
jgi:hypothetical protein